jgi:membrane protease YdiL (CAAX protease family)
MVARAGRRATAGLPPGVPRWPSRAGVFAVIGAIAVSVLAAIVAAGVLAVAGADERTAAGTLLYWALAAPGFVWVVLWVARRPQPPCAADLGLRPIAPARALRVLAPAVGGFALFVAAWALVVDLDAALPVPGEVAPDGPLGRARATGAIDLGADTLMLALALGVVAVLGIEILLRGFVLPALSSWRGTLPAAAIVCLLGTATGSTKPELLVCAAVLQLLLCGLYLLTGTLLPGIALGAGVSGLALGAAYGWSMAAAVGLAALCVALATALAMVLATRWR